MKITMVKVLDNNKYDMDELEKGQLHRGWQVQSITPVAVQFASYAAFGLVVTIYRRAI